MRLRLSKALLAAAGAQAMMGESIAFERGVATEKIAEAIAAKSPTVIRAAKESLNGIDLWDVKRSYRFEQGFTFELNLSGVADEHRDAFVDKRATDTTR